MHVKAEDANGESRSLCISQGDMSRTMSLNTRQKTVQVQVSKFLEARDRICEEVWVRADPTIPEWSVGPRVWNVSSGTQISKPRNKKSRGGPFGDNIIHNYTG